MPRLGVAALALAAFAGGPLRWGCDDDEPLRPVVVAPPPAPATGEGATAARAPATAEARGEIRCPDDGTAAIFVSPRAPRAGAPLRLIAVSRRPFDGALSVQGPDRQAISIATTRGGGPPYWAYGELAAPVEGGYRAALEGGGRGLACAEIRVGSADARAPAGRGSGQAWRDVAVWTSAAEDLYSAWIERLFDDVAGPSPAASEQPSWPALHEVLRDPRRNLLHDHLGLDEDAAPPRGLSLEPDCADLPYFLRAYFAFKLGLPFGFSSCTRGAGGAPPECLRLHTNREPPPERRRDAIAGFGAFLRLTVADTVHSGSGRVPAESDGGDYYPVPLSAESLRPGTVYADPYGHVLVVAKRIPQSEASGGVLLAVDGQPDGTVARRRYWRGNFLFALDPALGSPGFKRFRPVVKEGAGLRELTNDEIARREEYGDYARDQGALGVEGFYDAMDDVLSPAPLDPTRALLENIQALEEQVRGRVGSVKNGQAYRAAGNETIPMPKGAAIFETEGPWEDYSTPSRDLRLLIAIDVVRAFPARVARRPERYAMPPGQSAEQVRAALEATLGRELASRKIAYPRSDGSEHTLSLAEVVARTAALEMAYNPNDCAEVRWGAPEGSDEAATCARRAPSKQRATMRRYRAWFHERRRPPRQG